eukprot:scaffold298558_cov18-Tisochrysis_lutea.AAC.1
MSTSPGVPGHAGHDVLNALSGGYSLGIPSGRLVNHQCLGLTHTFAVTATQLPLRGQQQQPVHELEDVKITLTGKPHAAHLPLRRQQQQPVHEPEDVWPGLMDGHQNRHPIPCQACHDVHHTCRVGGVQAC